MAKKKSNKLGGVLGAVAIGVGVVAAALLSNKQNRAKVKSAVSSASKKAAPVVKKVAKRAEVALKKEAKSAAKSVSKTAKSASKATKAAAKSVKKSSAAKTVKKAAK